MILAIDIVVSDIAEGEKATYDYRLFNDVEELAFLHFCRDQTGCEAVRCIHRLSEELRNFSS